MEFGEQISYRVSTLSTSTTPEKRSRGERLPETLVARVNKLVQARSWVCLSTTSTTLAIRSSSPGPRRSRVPCVRSRSKFEKLAARQL